jgi:predicted RNA-binding Zn ribbon-like protein
LLVKCISMETPRESPTEGVRRMRLVGGDLALDFVNTRSGVPGDAGADDVLTGYAALVDWGVYAGELTAEEARRLERRARRDPSAAEQTFSRAVGMRELLDSIVRPLATGGRPDDRLLSALRSAEADAIAHARLAAGPTYSWTWRDDATLDRPLRPVVHSAVGLITSRAVDRMKACPGCGFLFIDASKNRSRRWCSMDDCGTDEKIRRYVERRSRSASA